MKKCLILILVLMFKAGIAQQDYATIHLIVGRGAYGINLPFTLYINEHLVVNAGSFEEINVKYYSKGYTSLTLLFSTSKVGASIEIKDNKDYYVICAPFSFDVSPKEVDLAKYMEYKNKAKRVFDIEEDKRKPWGSSATSASIERSKGGTCFAISKNGYLITNYHVIDGATEITVKGIDGDLTTRYGATLVSADKSNDLALLKIGNKNVTFDSIPYAIRSSGVAQGERIYAYGYPLTTAMGNEIKLTDGIISARSGVEGDISKFQVSAAVQPGNSGGPLIDEQGNVIGVIYAKSTVADAASYAVKASYLETFLKNVDGFEFPNYVNTIKDKPLTDKVAKLRDYIFIVETN